MPITGTPKRGDLVRVKSEQSGLFGFFMVNSFDVASSSMQVTPLDLDPSVIVPDWPKPITLAEVDALFACTEVGF